MADDIKEVLVKVGRGKDGRGDYRLMHPKDRKHGDPVVRGYRGDNKERVPVDKGAL